MSAKMHYSKDKNHGLLNAIDNSVIIVELQVVYQNNFIFFGFVPGREKSLVSPVCKIYPATLFSSKGGQTGLRKN